MNISFIPTMGALHDGHLSLVRAAKKREESVLVSIFVNPTQFGPTEDFATYPRSLKEDSEKLLSAGVDAVFLPTKEEVYSKGVLPKLKPLPAVFSELEGASRPTHFLGVAQILFRFLEWIRPTRLFLGQKDFQQTVLASFVLREYFPKTILEVCPIFREESGLAMSSRNAYLSPEGRKKAAHIYTALRAGKEAFLRGFSPDMATNLVTEKLIAAGIEKIFYVEWRNTEDLSVFRREKEGVLLLAVKFEGVRLLDNERVNGE